MPDLLYFAAVALAGVVLTPLTIGCFALCVGMGIEIALLLRAAIWRNNE